MRRFRFQLTTAVSLAVLPVVSCTHETYHQTPEPGFRPDSEYASAFLEAEHTATIAVYPSNVRRVEGTTHSVASQEQIVSLLKKKKMKAVVAETGAIDPGPLTGTSQWEMFENDMQAIAEVLKSRQSDSQYSLIMGFLFPPASQDVFGIHCYVIDQQGENAFSFLINSHHKLFVDANLRARDSSQSARTKLVEKATQVGVTALTQQLKVARDPDRPNREGYVITTTKIRAFDEKVNRILVIARVEERLRPVFLRSFEHSLISAFESNGVEAMFRLEPEEPEEPEESDGPADYENQLEAFAPDATMRINVDVLYRKHKLGHQAVVGTDFDVTLIGMTTGKEVWHATGKVDYIADFFFNRRQYAAHEGIRKEFAWHTAAAIVRAFTVDVKNQKSAPIYTVTEDRQRHGQRAD